jgi:hypothetical protein
VAAAENGLHIRICRIFLRNLWYFFNPFIAMLPFADLPISLPVAKPGVSKWGVKGRVRKGAYPLLLGARGCAPGNIFKLQMHEGEF